MRKYYGEDAVCPVYVQVEDGERLSRALNREREQENPRYEKCVEDLLQISRIFQRKYSERRDRETFSEYKS